MSDVAFSTKGKPNFTIGPYKFILTNTLPDETEKFNWVHVTGEPQEKKLVMKKKGKKVATTYATETGRMVVPPTLDGMKKKVMPIKTKNKFAKVFKKYIKDGWIHKSDVKSLHSELLKLGEDVVEKIDLIIGE